MVKLSKASLLLYLSVMIANLCSCIADTRHLSFLSIGKDGWAYTDTLTYTIAPLNHVEKSGLSLLLHTEGYAYENIAFDITIYQDTILIYHEQRSYLLEPNLVQSGIGRRYDYTLPISNITLCDTLPTTITIAQQLDQPILTGIREVGIHISEPLRQPGEAVWKVKW